MGEKCDKKREIEIENICFLGFQDIREGVTLRRVILWRLGCIYSFHILYIKFS